MASIPGNAAVALKLEAVKKAMQRKSDTPPPFDRQQSPVRACAVFTGHHTSRQQILEALQGASLSAAPCTCSWLLRGVLQPTLRDRLQSAAC